MQEKIILDSGNDKISFEAHVIRGLEKYSGLMFSRKNSADILLFKFKKPTRLAIHSFFVMFPFLAIWLDSDGKIIEIKRIHPFSPYILPHKEFSSFIEIPINEKNKKIIDDIERFK